MGERKLQELMEAKRKQQALAAERKKKLGGAFALDEDDIEGDTNHLADWSAARRQLSQKKTAGVFQPLAEVGRSSSASSRRSEAMAPDRLMETGATVTAADIDGSFHDHKFAHAWKDWDATKKDNAGEVAKRFMRIAALKRRR